MKKIFVLILTAVALATVASAVEYDTTLIADKNDMEAVLARHPGLTRESLLAHNLGLRNRGGHLLAGEKLIIVVAEAPKTAAVKAPDKVKTEDKATESKSPSDTSVTLVAGGEERKDFSLLYSTIYVEVPVKNWGYVLAEGMEMWTRDHNYNAVQNITHYNVGAGVPMRTEVYKRTLTFIPVVKVGQDYRHNWNPGIQRGVQLTAEIKLGYDRLWNEMVGQVNTDQSSFWTRDRLLVGINYTGPVKFSVGGEYRGWGWENTDPTFPGKYCYILGGGLLLKAETASKDHPVSLLIGGGTSSADKKDQAKEYYGMADLQVRFY